jgi:hypothetical protein
MSVFETLPREWTALTSLVDWITADNGDAGALTSLVEDLLPPPADTDFAGRPALRAAWTSHSAVVRTAAILRLAQLNDWAEDEERAQPFEHRDDFAALCEWGRIYAIFLRRTLTEPADQIQIAETLATLADVLGQDLGERTAEFIVETVAKARLPIYLIGALFEDVAKSEGGKIRPVSFHRRLQTMEPRFRRAWRAAADARAFVEYLEPALVYVRDHLSEESPPSRAGFH